jgi:hypothetical protein
VAELLLNGRPPLAWELPAIARAYACARERDLRLLAGLLPAPGAAYPPRVAPPPGTVADLAGARGEFL